jgi:phospholipid/cholesterol/gamma-HCH transport system ATP-binding protein
MRLQGLRELPRQELRRRAQTDDLIRVVALSTFFGERCVLQDVDFAIRRGEVHVIMGPSGCGKTTLLRHLNGLRQPSLGSVYVDGRDLYRMPAAELRAFRMRTGTSFQGGALLASMTVLDNVMMPLLESTDLAPDLARMVARIKLDMVGLLDAESRQPADLSGGMRKRAAIARAIALDPEILFLDEPSAGLDPLTAAELDRLIVKLNQVFGITMVVVTHDLDSAFSVADRISMFLGGRLLATGSREQIRSSADPCISDFVRRRLPAEAARDVELTDYLAI